MVSLNSDRKIKKTLLNKKRFNEKFYFKKLKHFKNIINTYPENFSHKNQDN